MYDQVFRSIHFTQASAVLWVWVWWNLLRAETTTVILVRNMQSITILPHVVCGAQTLWHCHWAEAEYVVLARTSGQVGFPPFRCRAGIGHEPRFRDVLGLFPCIVTARSAPKTFEFINSRLGSQQLERHVSCDDGNT
jgi:hypothetical protein